MKVSDIHCVMCDVSYADHHKKPHGHHDFKPPEGFLMHCGRLWDVRTDLDKQQQERKLAAWRMGENAGRLRELGYIIVTEIPDYWVTKYDVSSPTGRRWADPDPVPEFCLAV
jgi:hypothetical protein